MERSELLEKHQKIWDQMMVDRRQKEVDYMMAREQHVEEFERQLQDMRIQDAEEYNQVKIKLETDVQVHCCIQLLHSCSVITKFLDCF